VVILSYAQSIYEVINLDIYKPQEFAEMIGVSIKTLQRWDNAGKLKAYRSPTDRRFYTHEQYIKYMGDCARKGDEEIVKELQDGNKPDRRTKTDNQ